VGGGKARTRVPLTRERILAESAREFNRRGYHATTLDDIARALGVTKAALYYYVKNKEDVLFECHQKALDLAIDAVRTALLRSSAPDEQLRTVVVRYIEGMTDQLAGAVVLLHEGALSAPLNRKILDQRDEYERILRRIIDDGITRNVFVPCDAKLIGFAILGALNWISRWYNPSGPRSAKEVAATFAEYFVRGLLVHPTAGLPYRPGASNGGRSRQPTRHTRRSND
jgi:TetR/AcrR family transcriptional regulator